MKKTLAILIICSFTGLAKSPFFCIGGATFVTSDLARMAKTSCTIKATFDVRGFKPTNIRLTQTDTSLIGFLTQETLENLNRITYLSDTVGATLFLYYEHLPASGVSGDFGRILSDSEVQLVFRGPTEHYSRNEGLRRIIPQTGDTIFWSSIVIGTPLTSEPSQILVERIFHASKDSTVIIENNHPELAGEILGAAKQIGLNWFLHLQYPALRDDAISEQKYPEAYKKKYVIRFRILRRIPSCNSEIEI